MPRRPRDHIPGVPLHIIQRGNNRKPCFHTMRDYTVYLNTLRKYSGKFQVAIHNFVLMTNHVHLLLTPSSKTGASDMMQSLGRYYVRYFNDRHGRTGTLWEGRFKDSLVDTETYFLTLSKYIELNPVRACMVKHPADYPWSSYRHNALGKCIRLLTEHSIYQSLGANDGERQRNYTALFAEAIPESTLQKIRTAVNKSWVLGSDEFKQAIEEKLGYPLPPLPRGGDRKSASYRQIRDQTTLTPLIGGAPLRRPAGSAILRDRSTGRGFPDNST